MNNIVRKKNFNISEEFFNVVYEDTEAKIISNLYDKIISGNHPLVVDFFRNIEMVK